MWPFVRLAWSVGPLAYIHELKVSSQRPQSGLERVVVVQAPNARFLFGYPCRRVRHRSDVEVESLGTLGVFLKRFLGPGRRHDLGPFNSPAWLASVLWRNEIHHLALFHEVA